MNVRCPICRNRLLQKGVLRVDHPITIDEQGTRARCHHCKQIVPIPLVWMPESREPIRDSVDSPTGPP